MDIDNILVYVAGPYTLPVGQEEANVWHAIDTCDFLMDKGFIPYNPLLSHYHHLRCPRDYEWWLAFDLKWLKACDVLYRIPGKSNGADKEVLFTIEKLGKPVFYTVTDLLLWRDNLKEIVKDAKGNKD